MREKNNKLPDYSEYGAVPDHDYAEYGATPISADPHRNFMQQLEDAFNISQKIKGQYAKDIPAGLGQDIQGILNTPHNLISSKFPTSNININQKLGIQNPSSFDQAIQNISSYLPYAAGGEGLLGPKLGASALGKLGTQAAIGGAYGATQSDTPIKSALEDAGLNAATFLGLSGLKSSPELLNYAKQRLAPYVTQGLLKKTTANLGDVLNLTKQNANQNAFEMAKNNFSKYEKDEENAWDKLKNTAVLADANDINFDSSNYQNSLKNKLNNLQNQSESQSAFSRKNKEGISLLEGYLNDKYSSFRDAIQHNQALNADYQNEITPGKSLPFDIVNYAKNNIKNTINKNIENNKLQETLGNSWQQANNTTAEKNKIFNELIGSTGKQQNSTFATMNKFQNPFGDVTTFVQDYVPKGKGDGIQRMQQFSEMLGDENHAKNVIKMNYFENALTSNGIEAPEFISKYDNLSSAQQDYLFNPEENRQLRTLSKINENNKSFLKGPKSNTSLLHYAVMPALGATIGKAFGIPWVEGYLGSGVAMSASHALLSKIMENPKLSEKLSEQLMNPSKKIKPLGKSGRNALASLLTPQLNQQGSAQNGTRQ